MEAVIYLGWIHVHTSVRETATLGAWRSRLSARETPGSEDDQERDSGHVCVYVRDNQRHHAQDSHWVD